MRRGPKAAQIMATSGESLLAACGGDTVKLFDVSVEAGDPCAFHYTPTPSCQVNCAKWNHTNLVVASAGEDRKISLWMKNGQTVGAVPQSGNDLGDYVDESILAICFSSKGSRYLCSGGTGKVVRVWDLQRRRCIKWLKGHTDTITGVMYNCKDEHLASISLKGDLILHNLASGARAAELKDPHEQVLRVLDYSRTSRHILVTAGDDGSIHMWDTTGRSPKVSWLKQHSAPTTGVCFSPSNDKMVVSVGLDKKLYTFDPGMKKPAYCTPCEAPFSSLAFKDDGLILAAGTNTGRVVFYDVRGKPQPFTILRAYNNSEAVTSLCWQRSKPILVNEANCSLESALLGAAGEDSILMPDPLPASTSISHGSTSMSTTPARTSGRFAFSTTEGSPISVSGISVASVRSSPGEEYQGGNHLRTNGTVSRLQTRNNFSFKDDMEVFSPLVDVQPITPSVGSFWDNREDSKKEGALGDNPRKLAWIPSPPSAIRRFPSVDELGSESYLTFDRRLSTKQEDSLSKVSSSQLATPTPGISLKGDRSPSVTPPEAWGGDLPTDRFNLRQQSVHNVSRFASSAPSDSNSILSATVSYNPQDTLPSTTSGTADYSANMNFNTSHVTGVEFPNIENAGTSETLPVLPVSGISSSLGSKSIIVPSNIETSTSLPMGLPRRYMAYVDRKANANLPRGVSLPGDGALPNAGSPKQKKTGTERREEKTGPDAPSDGKKDSENAMFSRSDVTSATISSSIPANLDYNPQGPPSFALQLVQRTLEESLGSVQRAIHEDVQNLHLELLRQFHIQQTEMGCLMNSVLEKQSDLLKEVKALRRENEQLRQLL